MRIGSNEPEERFSLLKTTPQQVTQALPPVKSPLGLSLERQKYLFKEIRPFLDEDKMDLTAPDPEDADSDDDAEEQHNAGRRQRRRH